VDLIACNLASGPAGFPTYVTAGLRTRTGSHTGSKTTRHLFQFVTEKVEAGRNLLIPVCSRLAPGILYRIGARRKAARPSCWVIHSGRCAGDVHG